MNKKKDSFHYPDWPKRVEKLFQEAVKDAIQEHLNANNPVYYEKNKKLIMLLPSGKEKVISDKI